MYQHCQLIKFIRTRFNTLRYVTSTILDDGWAEGENGISFVRRRVHEHELADSVPRTSQEFNLNKKILVSKITPLPDPETESVFSCHAERLVRLRRVYNCLCDAVQLVNSMYGVVVMFMIIQNFTNLITSVNVIMNIIKGNCQHFCDPIPIIVHIISRLILSLGMLLTAIVSCHLTVLESKELRSDVQKLLLKYPLGSDTIQQLKLFSHQLCNSEIQFTAFWLFNLDISFLCTIFASSITYIILLAQLT